MIDCYCSRPWYLAHLLPVWLALPPEHQGTFYVGGRLVEDAGAKALGAVPKNMTLLSPGPRVLVASQIDYQDVAPRRRVVYMQHGSGQSYGGDPESARAASYAGGDNQDRTDLFLMPGPHPAQRCRERYPHIPVAEIGCPALDRWLRDPPPKAREPIVGLAWHWENTWLCPEARSALPHFRSALPDLMERYAVIGHGHPRARDLAESVYEPLGIPWVDYDTLMTLASVLVVDNSSIAYEAAALGKSVVLLDAPWYRQDTHHGLRFWSEADVGFRCSEPMDLLDTVAEALNDPPEQRFRRDAAVRRVYSHLGNSSRRAANAILELESSKSLVEATT